MVAQRDEGGGRRGDVRGRESIPRNNKASSSVRGARAGERKGEEGGGGEDVGEASISGMAASTPSTVLATICIVDSSLAIAIEWGKISSEYLVPIIQRLAELAPNANQVTSHQALALSYSADPLPPVQDRIYHIWSRVLSPFAPALSAFLPAICSDEQGDQGRTRKVLHRPDWHRLQLRRYGCSRRHRRCTRGICPQFTAGLPPMLTTADV